MVMVTQNDNEQVADKTSPRPTVAPKQRGISAQTFFVSLVLVLAVGYIAGTRNAQLFAAIAPVFGIKASADTLNTEVLQQTYRSLKANYDGSLDATKLADGAARGMVAAAGDRYTVFMDAEEASEFQKELSGEVTGIGCEIGVRSGQPTVLRVIPESPAEKAGLKPGDIFVAVNDTSVKGGTSSDVAEKVRGEAGTSVKLTVKRGEANQEFTITRAKVSDPSVRSSIKDGVGILTISRFDQDTGMLARKAATEFKSRSVKSVIVDLRNNGGGYLQAAQDVAGIWLDHKLVVTEKTGGKVTDEVKSTAKPILTGVKTIILVNGDSASASEIVAGALQDYGVATLVGEKTFGKGTVQQVLNLQGGRVLKVTIARWYTPKGKNITAQGISPDTKVTMTAKDVDAGRDPQLDAALKSVK